MSLKAKFYELEIKIAPATVVPPSLQEQAHMAPANDYRQMGPRADEFSAAGHSAIGPDGCQIVALLGVAATATKYLYTSGVSPHDE